MKPQAILFDLDNTLLDRTRTFRAFVDRLVETYLGHLAPAEEICAMIVERDRDGYKDKDELFAELVEELPWQRRPEAAELMAFYLEQYVREAVLMPEARETLALARSLGCKLALITNGKTAVQYGKLDRLGIRDAFDATLVSEEAGVRKPDPAIFEMALRRLDVTAQDCLFVGDHPVNDIAAAAELGMRTIWLKVNQPWPEELRVAPDLTIHRLGELLDWLDTPETGGSE
ncbi:hypothetical protein PA598K_06165 [Paenibacillus sp. 598K]|uniref:HAD family hydrolase n=1 Tax=Paenibacillus sp. 598K TaxID=1117987 RepID=UPI000FF917C2|nr:HAD family hydrolase [Paenibacillus sp. 598K]GBF77608.1 hypothetical protein PA598K_06165 [Paenibacillus sp. 598K]